MRRISPTRSTTPWELLLNADGSPTELARQIAESYVEIMVDEYQDTNEVQNCIFSAISRKGGNLLLWATSSRASIASAWHSRRYSWRNTRAIATRMLLSQARPQDTAHPQFPVPAGGAGGYELHFSQYPLPPDGGDGVRPGGAAVSWGRLICRAGPGDGAAPCQRGEHGGRGL